MALSEELKGNEKGLYKRAMPYNIRVLSSFSIFITRDMCKVMESIFLEQLIKKAQSKRLEATGGEILWHVGHYGSSGTGRCNSPYIGTGERRLEKYMLHGKFHKMLSKRTKRAKVEQEGFRPLTDQDAWTKGWPEGIIQEELM